MLFCESEAEPAARSRAMTARMPEHTEAMDAKPLPSRLTQLAARRRSTWHAQATLRHRRS
jgi:hypothetical protein